MKKAVQWIAENHAQRINDLAELVAIPSISTDGEHQREIDACADLVARQMQEAGLQNVDLLRSHGSNPYVYGEWLGAPGKPTVFLYSHYDVQPINYEAKWLSPPWTLTARDGRLYGRGAADDKGAITAHLGAIAGFLKTIGELPVNVKMVVEGEEEIGSKNLDGFFHEHKEKLKSDVIVVCDTDNIEVGTPCITYSLRGIVAVLVEVESATRPVHSGQAGGALADSAIALSVILSRLYGKDGRLPPELEDKAHVRKIDPALRRTIKKLGFDPEKFRRDAGVLPGVQLANRKNVDVRQQTWRLPSANVIALEASSIKHASNQILPKAQAIVSCRIVPDQDPQEVLKNLQELLSKDPPWNVRVNVSPLGAPVKWWITDPKGPAFDAAMKALKAGYGTKPLAIGCGGSIGFVGPLSELFDDAPALLLGIEDPQTNAHAPNESLHEDDFRKLTISLAHLFTNLSKLSDVKAPSSKKEPKTVAEEAPASSSTETPASAETETSRPASE
ncbi:MAG: dipeptidase [Gemmatales bacterium]|nr:MAG: dipeptidase [Gemmatales bacterium]